MLKQLKNAGSETAFEFSPDQLTKLDESLAQADAKTFASDVSVAKIFDRFRPE